MRFELEIIIERVTVEGVPIERVNEERVTVEGVVIEGIVWHVRFGPHDLRVRCDVVCRYVVRERKTEQEGDGFVYTIGESAVSDFGVRNIKKAFAKVREDIGKRYG